MEIEIATIFYQILRNRKENSNGDKRQRKGRWSETKTNKKNPKDIEGGKEGDDVG